MGVNGSTRGLGATVFGIVLLGIALPSQTLRAQGTSVSPQLPLTHFTVDHRQMPLPSSSVQKIHQDRAGHLWLAFYTSGLTHFAPHGPETYDLRDGLPDPMVREIVEDAQGYLWIGTEAGLAVSDRPLASIPDHQRLRFHRSVGDIGLVDQRIRRGGLVRGPSGGVWVSTGRGIEHYQRTESEGLQLRTWGDGGKGSTRAVILPRRNGELWIAYRDGDLAVLNTQAQGPAKAWRWMSEDSLPTSPITALHQGPSGAIWAGSFDGGIWRYEHSSEAFEPLNGLLTEMVYDLLETADGALWVASVGAGVLRLDAERTSSGLHVTRRQGLPSETVWHLFSDRDGALWIAHNAGVSRLRADFEAFEHWTGEFLNGESPALPESTVFAVLSPQSSTSQEPSAANLLWVGTGGGLAAIAPKTRQATFIGIEEGLMSTSVYGLAKDDRGRVWIATQAGLNVLTFGAPRPPALTVVLGNDLEILGRQATLLSYGLGTLYEVRAHRVAAATPAVEADDGTDLGIWLSGVDGVAGLVGERWFQFGPASGLAAAGATSTAFDDQRRLWVGSKDGGVFRSRQPMTAEYLDELIDSESSSRVVAGELFEPVWNRRLGAPSNSVRRLVWAEGKMFLATPAGVVALDGDTAAPLLQVDRASGLGGDNVMGLVVDGATGNLWVAQNRGLAELTTDGKVIRLVNRDDGLIDDEIWLPSALAADGAGNIYLGTPKGLTHYRPALDRP